VNDTERRVERLLTQFKQAEKELITMKHQGKTAGISSKNEAQGVFGNTPIHLHKMDSETDQKLLRKHLESLLAAKPSCAHIATTGAKIICYAPKENSSNFQAGDFVNKLMKEFGGTGGGSATVAQGQLQKEDAFQAIKNWSLFNNAS
jgi:alanyl-tRNA synthetase